MVLPKYCNSIWFWWTVITVLYIAAFLLSAAKLIPHTIPATIGLFAPFGVFSVIMLLSYWGWLNLAVFIALMFGTEHLIDRVKVTLFQKIGIIFVSLFILTLILDAIHFTPFLSIKWLLYGAQLKEFKFDP